MLTQRSMRMLIITGLMLSIFASAQVHLLSAQAATAEPPYPITITMTEYKFSIEGQADATPLQLETGKEYELHFKNAGTLEHEVLIGSGPIIIKDGFHHDFHHLLLSDVEVVLSGQMNGGDFTIGVAGLNEFQLKAGQEMVTTFTLPDNKVGAWEMGCFVSLNLNATDTDPGAGHYDVGMHIPVNVVAGSGA